MPPQSANAFGFWLLVFSWSGLPDSDSGMDVGGGSCAPLDQNLVWSAALSLFRGCYFLTPWAEPDRLLVLSRGHVLSFSTFSLCSLRKLPLDLPLSAAGESSLPLFIKGCHHTWSALRSCAGGGALGSFDWVQTRKGRLFEEYRIQWGQLTQSHKAGRRLCSL